MSKDLRKLTNHLQEWTYELLQNDILYSNDKFDPKIEEKVDQ